MKKLIALALVVIMPFSNPIIGGNDTLIRDKIQSENFVSGVSGWRIERNGNAEFNDLLARGELVIGDYPNGEHAIGGGVDAPNGWAFYSNNSEEVGPATLQAIDQGTLGTLLANSPDLGGSQASLALQTYQAAFSNKTVAQLTAHEIILGTFGGASDLIQVNQDITRTGQAWANLTLVNSWVQDTANAPAAVGDAAPSYYKDPTGVVHVRGYIKSGTAITIATLPAGFRPRLTYESPLMRSNTGSANFSTVRVQTSGVLDVLTNLTPAQTRLTLNFSFPTF